MNPQNAVRSINHASRHPGLSWLSTLVGLLLTNFCLAVPTQALTPIRSVAAKQKPPGIEQAKALMQPLGADAALRSAPVILFPLPKEFVDQLISEDSLAKGRLRVGVARSLDQPLVVNGSTVSAGQWTTLANGTRVFSVLLDAEGAIGLRVQVESVRLPAGSRLLVYDANAPAPSASTTSEELAGQPDFLLPTVFSGKVILECQVPTGVNLSTVAFTIKQVTHLFRPLVPETLAKDLAKEGPCHNDVSCYSSWLNQASGVALMHFQDAYNSYACTGSLLNDGDPTTYIDYFLTANHCIDTAALASTLECFWFYQTPYCHGPVPSLSSVPHTSGGADYLTSNPISDFSLLRLRQASPGGAQYLGWTTGLPSSGETLTVIHHPDNSYKRISFSRLDSYDSDFWTVRYFSGVTEAGSSGAPLFNSNGQIIGQLYGGPSSCSNPNGTDDYGRFDVTYDYIRSWIDPVSFSVTGLPTINGVTGDAVTLGAETVCSGSFPYMVETGGMMSSRMVAVVGLVNSSGQMVGGTPQVVYDATLSSGGSGTASWSSLTLPALGGIYKLRYQAYVGMDPTTCVNRFASNPPISDSGSLQGLVATIVVPAVHPWALWWQSNNRAIATWSMDGPNACSYQQPVLNLGAVPPGWNVFGVADFDGNGSPDLLWRNTDGYLAMWLMSGTNRISANPVGTGRIVGWRIGATGDFDGDGHADIIWQHTSGATAIWYMNGFNIISTSPLQGVPIPSSAWRLAAAGDVDGDGHLDLIWQSTGGSTAVWFMNGIKYKSSAYFNVRPVATGWRLVGVVDLLHEGYADLLWQHDNGSLVYWLMDGINLAASGSLNPPSINPAWRIVGAQ